MLFGEKTNKHWNRIEDNRLSEAQCELVLQEEAFEEVLKAPAAAQMSAERRQKNPPKKTHELPHIVKAANVQSENIKGCTSQRPVATFVPCKMRIAFELKAIKCTYSHMVFPI